MGDVDDVRNGATALEVTVDGSRLRARGEIDASTARLLAEQLDPLPGSTGEIELDMAGIAFVDSSGLRVLIDAHQRAERAGRSLTIVDPSHVVRRLLDISGLEGVLRVRPGRA